MISYAALMQYKGVLRDMYSICSSDEYILNEEISKKSLKFKKINSSVKKWLGDNFDTTRGKNCYDIILKITLY